MDRNIKLKEIDIKNRTCYYFDDTININDLDLGNILLNKKSYKNVLSYDLAYKTSYGSKPLHIIFDKVDSSLGKYDETKYLALFHSDEKYEIISDRIRYLMMLESNILGVYSHKFTKIKINSVDDLPLENTLNMCNAVILVMSVFNKSHNHSYHRVFLNKCSYK